VTATCRAPDEAAALQALGAAELIQIAPLGVANLGAAERRAARIEAPIDALVNNAGIAWRDTRFGALDYEVWRLDTEFTPAVAGGRPRARRAIAARAWRTRSSA